MPNALDLLNQIKTLAQQATDTVTAALPDGATENVYTIDSDTQLLLWCNEAQNRMARLNMPIYDSASVIPANAGDTVLSPVSLITSSTGRVLTTPTQVFCGTKKMRPASEGYLSNTRWYPPTIAGNPTAWAWALTSITLSSYTTQPEFNINGYFLPTKLKFASTGATVSGTTLTVTTAPATAEPSSAIVTGVDQVYLSGGSVTEGLYTISAKTSATVYTLASAPGNSAANVKVASPLDSSIDDFCYLTMAFYGLMKLGMKNQDNSVLAERAIPGMSEWTNNMKEIYARMIQNDSSLRSIFVPTALDAAMNQVAGTTRI